MFVLSIILVLSFVFTACAPKPTEAPAVEPPAAEEPVATEAPVAEVTAAPVERTLVKIAFIGPLTGQNAAMGTGGLNSVTLAVQEANANPDYKYTYEIVPIDDECKPEVAVQAALDGDQ